MPPIKVHIDDPINPQNANTVDSEASQQPSAMPGAAAVPAPTPYAPKPLATPAPTRTTPSEQNEPPPPQPGAVPIPPGQNAASTASNTIPPPPRAGEAAQWRSPATTSPPAQMTIPSPQQNYAPSRGTSTTFSPPARADATTLNFGAAPVPQQIQPGSHPPGYQQDLNAQEMTSAARASLDVQDRMEGRSQNLGLSGDSTSETAENVWNAVKGWANAAGNTLVETEKEVWKRINGQ